MKKCDNCGTDTLWPGRQQDQLVCKTCGLVHIVDKQIIAWEKVQEKADQLKKSLDIICLHPAMGLHKVDVLRNILMEMGCVLIKVTEHDSWAGNGCEIAIPFVLKDDPRVIECRKEEKNQFDFEWMVRHY